MIEKTDEQLEAEMKKPWLTRTYASLCDFFSFREMFVCSSVKTIYFLVTLGLLWELIGNIRSEDGEAGVMTVLMLIGARILAEFIIVGFKISDDLTDIREALLAKNSEEQIAKAE